MFSYTAEAAEEEVESWGCYIGNVIPNDINESE